MYPVLVWFIFFYLRAHKRKVLYLRVSRASDSLLVAPLLIALAVVLGNAGLPSDCEQLWLFSRDTYLSLGKRASANFAVECNANATNNECGTGKNQLHDMGKICRTARAGFSLVIVTM